jgi:hypothetical protein
VAQLAIADISEPSFSDGTEEQQHHWTQVYDIAHFDATQRELIHGFH